MGELEPDEDQRCTQYPYSYFQLVLVSCPFRTLDRAEEIEPSSRKDLHHYLWQSQAWLCVRFHEDQTQKVTTLVGRFVSKDPPYVLCHLLFSSIIHNTTFLKISLWKETVFCVKLQADNHKAFCNPVASPKFRMDNPSFEQCAIALA